MSAQPPSATVERAGTVATHPARDRTQAPSYSLSIEEVLSRFKTTTANGLSTANVSAARQRWGGNRLASSNRAGVVKLLWRQFSSPIVLILLAATVLSFLLGDSTDTVIILTIVLASGLLGFWQERGAAGAVAKLLALVEVRTRVVRDGQTTEIAAADVVPGDIALLGAGATSPGDCLLLESRDLFVDEAALTGETFPVEKCPSVLSADTPLSKRSNSIFMGTHVVSGTGRALVVAVGKETEFGKVSERLRLRSPDTEFERGVRRLGYLLMEVTLLLVMGIFAFNVYLHRPVLESLLFSLALAVGLTPQLLPAIVTMNLARGARRMAERKVIVKRLASIENFGSMDVLCTDKTGTLTEGVVTLHGAFDIAGRESREVLLFAHLNASFEAGLPNPIDGALRAQTSPEAADWHKLDEIPYDFVRKMLSIATAGPKGNLMITKGAMSAVLGICTLARDAAGADIPLSQVRDHIDVKLAQYSAEGFRTLGVCSRDLGTVTRLDKDSEAGMVFVGFLVLQDRPKPGVALAVRRLRELGVTLKVITGDSALVAAHVAHEIGLEGSERVLSGRDLAHMSDDALLARVDHVAVFAEVEPNQKERLLLAVRKAGHVVGYLGDGINDASALHAADVGLSVDTAVDVAKDVADIVLLDKDLGVLVDGVAEGRKTFANTLKYVLMATSANFGNMFSMAGASLLLPFLPLLPQQILLTNFLTDMPEMTISGDAVDPELVATPRRWDIGFIRSFMITFGVLSSLFDFLMFGVLSLVLHAGVTEFRTAWFVESVVSAALVVLIVRSRKPVLSSTLGRPLLWTSLSVVAATFALPFTPLGRIVGFAPLSGKYLGLVIAVVIVYALSAELAKQFFYRLADRKRIR